MKIRFIIKGILLIWQHNRLWLTASLFIHIINGLLPLASLAITQSLVNNVSLLINGHIDRAQQILLMLILGFIIAILESMSIHLKDLNDQYGQIKMDYIIGKQVSEKMASVPYGFYDLPEFYHHFNRISGNYGMRIMSPIQNVLNMVQNIISLVSYLVFLWFVHWSLVVLCLIVAFPILLVESKYGSAKFFLMRFLTPEAREAGYTSGLLQDRQGAKEIRLFSLAPFLLEKWTQLYWKNNREMLKLIRKEKSAYIGLDMCTALVYAGAAGISIWLLKASRLQVGGFVAMTQAIKGAQNAINMIASYLAKVYEEHLYIEDLFKFLQFESSHIKTSCKNKTMPFPTSLKQGIVFEHVSFRYPKMTQDILDDVTFTIRPGEKIAIVGENGSGKTTLVKCLLGLYAVTEGCIKIDGTNIEEINDESLHRHFTVIFQDFMQYAYSVQDNIAFGDIERQKDQKEIHRAALLSGVDAFAKNFTDGYNTKLGRILADGEDLSGGQWQKIALGRALFRDAEIIILDEPTAALDPQTELEVFNHFHTLTKDKTAIYISHRMAAARMADRIFVMKKGSLIEVGSHSELMKRKGEYQKMFKMQAKWYV